MAALLIIDIISIYTPEMEQQSGIEYEQFTKPELIEMLKLEKDTNRTLSEMVKSVHARAAKLVRNLVSSLRG